MRTYADSWLKVEEGLGGVRPVLKGSADELRAQFGGLLAALAPGYPQPSGSVKTEDGTLDAIKYRIYIPTGLGDGGGLPVGVYYHPGGFVLGQSEADEVLCRHIAENTKSIIFSVQYRLSPEHKAPAHLQDTMKAFEWANENATKFGGDPNKMYTIGVSAGAGLALAVARKVTLGQSTASRDAVKGIVSFGPYTLHQDNIPQAYKSTYTSHEENGENVPVIDATTMRQFFELAGLSPEDRDYFPALDQGHHKHFPPTYIVTCEFDPLRDDGLVMAQSLKAAGVPVKADHYDGLPHCFWLFPSLPETEVFMKNAVDGVKWVINQM